MPPFALAALPWLKANWRLVAAGVGIVALLYIGHRAYNSIYKAGATGVTVKVQQDTIDAQEKARRNREAEDARIKNTPFGDRVDQLP